MRSTPSLRAEPAATPRPAARREQLHHPVGNFCSYQPVTPNILAIASTSGGKEDRLMTEVQPLDRTLNRRFAVPAEEARVVRTAAALEANGITVFRAPNSAEAKRIVLDLIPVGSQVHHGASQSLETSGIAAEIERSGRYEPLRPRVLGMDRTT